MRAVVRDESGDFEVDLGEIHPLDVDRIREWLELTHMWYDADGRLCSVTTQMNLSRGRFEFIVDD